MSDVFISYKREDEARVLRLVRGLEAEGVSVWWDRGLPGGDSWRANIQSALDGARMVVVCWTELSTGPVGDFVRDEAVRAKERGILIPVFLDRVRPPLGFGEVQGIDLVHWRGDRGDPFFQDLVGVIRSRLDGVPPPPAKGPAIRLLRRVRVGGAISALVAALFAFSANVFEVQQRACAAPGLQPGLSDVCGGWGLGGRPTREDRLAFEALPPGDCGALRRFADAHETSPLAAVATDRISRAILAVEDVWTPTETLIPLFVPPGPETAARATAARRAERVCSDLERTTGGDMRVVSAGVEADYGCEDGPCELRGNVVCNMERRDTLEREVCAGSTAR
jgi:hypothetical protein